MSDVYCGPAGMQGVGPEIAPAAAQAATGYVEWGAMVEAAGAARMTVNPERRLRQGILLWLPPTHSGHPHGVRFLYSSEVIVSSIDQYALLLLGWAVSCLQQIVMLLRKVRDRVRKVIGQVLVMVVFGWAGSANAGPMPPVTVDGREWLQPIDFINVSWNIVNEVCPAEPSGLCKGSLNGLDVTGYTWASVDDVNALFNAVVGSDVMGPGSTSTFIEPAGTWWDFFLLAGFVPTVEFIGTPIAAIGGNTRNTFFFGDTLSAPLSFANNNGYGDYMDTGTIFKIGLSDRADYAGAWLFRQTTIPSPATFALFTIGLAGLGWSRRKKV